MVTGSVYVIPIYLFIYLFSYFIHLSIYPDALNNVCSLLYCIA